MAYNNDLARAIRHETTRATERLDDETLLAIVDQQGPAPTAIEVFADHTDRYELDVVDESGTTKTVELRENASDVERLGAGFSR